MDGCNTACIAWGSRLAKFTVLLIRGRWRSKLPDTAHDSSGIPYVQCMAYLYVQYTCVCSLLWCKYSRYFTVQMVCLFKRFGLYQVIN